MRKLHVEYLALGAHGIQMNTHFQTKLYGNLGNIRVSATVLSSAHVAPSSDAKRSMLISHLSVPCKDSLSC